MLCQLVHESEREERCSRSRTLGKRDESELPRLAGGVSTKSFVSQCIELAGLHISLELMVPSLGVKRGIPGAKRRKLCGGKILNLLFNRFDFAHNITLLPSIPASGAGVSQVKIKLRAPRIGVSTVSSRYAAFRMALRRD